VSTTDESSAKIELDALKTLYGGHLGNLHAVSDRSFHMLLQTLTLNVAVVGGLVGLAAGKVILSDPGKWFGTILLFVFNATIIIYLLRQAYIYRRERQQLQKIKKALWDKCPSIKSDDKDEERFCCCPLWTGSGLFCVAVVIATFCSIAALWVPLVASSFQNAEAANRPLSRAAAQAARP
jgi:hypothetical protein